MVAGTIGVGGGKEKGGSSPSEHSKGQFTLRHARIPSCACVFLASGSVHIKTLTEMHDS
jgi:hypothetical protein